MKRILSYYFLCVSFAVLTALVYTSIAVFIFNVDDPKFGKLGLIYLAIYISGVTSATSSLSSTILFTYKYKQKNNQIEKHSIIYNSLFNGILFGLLYYPVIIYAPIANGIKDLPQYIVYFLILGVITTLISNFIYNYLKKPNTYEPFSSQ